MCKCKCTVQGMDRFRTVTVGWARVMCSCGGAKGMVLGANGVGS
jgi:hypothetical protein